MASAAAGASGKSETQLELERLRARRREMAAQTDLILASLGQPDNSGASMATMSTGVLLQHHSSAPAVQANGRPRANTLQPGGAGRGGSMPVVPSAAPVMASIVTPAGVPPLPIPIAGAGGSGGSATLSPPRQPTSQSAPAEFWPSSAPVGVSDPWAQAVPPQSRAGSQPPPATRERAATTGGGGGGGGRLGKLKGGVARKGSASLLKVGSMVAGKSPRAAAASSGGGLGLPQQELFSGWLHKEGDFGFANEFSRRFFILYTYELQVRFAAAATLENLKPCSVGSGSE